MSQQAQLEVNPYEALKPLFVHGEMVEPISGAKLTLRLQCPKCRSGTIAIWHRRAEVCDECFGDYLNLPSRCAGKATEDCDDWIRANWRDNRERLLEDYPC